MAAVVLRYWSAIVAPLNGYMEELATEEARHVIYGLLLRFIGLGYIVCFAAFIPQVLPIAGSRGYNPLAPQLKKLKKIYRSKAYWWFPSLFWLNASDFMLKFLPILGCLGGLGIIIGGPWTPWLFLMCWLITLSMDMAVDMIYPWDSFLLEFGFLCIWAPGLNMLPRATVRAMPTPLLSFAFRYVLFRLMLGFGKLKFTGTNQEDRLYIKHFFVYQPMASIIGWFANKLPNAFHVASLYIMFFVEVPLPFFVFFCGLPRLIAAFGFWGLQFGIQLGGNFGYFNLLYALASTVLLDHSASVWDISWATTFGGDWSDALFTLIYVYICAVSLLYFAFNSWCNLAWMYWPTLDKSPQFFQGLLTVIRLMQPLRLVQSYGVFPPNSAPGIRWVPVFEGSNDGKKWKQYEYKYMATNAKSKPCFVAPWHPRLDHTVFYEAVGQNAHNFLANLGSANPFRHTRSTPSVRIAQRLLEGTGTPVLNLFANDPFPDPDHPPKFVRVSLYVFRPTSVAHALKTGEYWDVLYSGVHLPPMSKDPTVWREWLPDPEGYNFESVRWRARAGSSAGILSEARYEATWRFLEEVVGIAQAATEAVQKEGRMGCSADEYDPFGEGPAEGSTTEFGKGVTVRTFEGSKHELLDRQTNAFLNSVCTYDVLPQVVATLRKKYTREQLLEYKAGVDLLRLPLLSRLTALYHRMVPTREQLEKELGEISGLALAPTDTDEWNFREEYLKLGKRIHVPLAPPTPVEATARNMFRIGMYADYLLLGLGRQQYEKVVGGAQAVLGTRIATAYEPSDNGMEGRLAAVFHELHFSDLNMASMSDESGFFLAGVLHYDTVAFHAMKFKISSGFSRVDRFESGGVLPGFLELTKNLATAKNLRLFFEGTSTLVPRLVIPRFACLPNGEWLCEDWCGRTARGLDWEDALKSTNERRRLSSLSPEAQ